MKENLPINKNTELFRWGPIQSRLFFVVDFLVGIFNEEYYPKLYPDYRWPKSVCLFKGKTMVFVEEMLEMRKVGGELFLKHILPDSAREKVWNSWKKDLTDLQAMEKKIDGLDLSNLSKEEFVSLWHDFHEATTRFWQNVTVPELANYGSLPILEHELEKFISDPIEIASAMEILTAPEESSFYQKEEIDLVETEDIETHQKKYFWLRNSYAEIEVLPVSFFEERKKEIPENMRQIIEERRKEIKKRKENLVRKYNLSEDLVKIAEAIVLCIEWQDERKADIWIYLHYKYLLLQEASKHLKVSPAELLNFRETEIEEWIKGKNLENKISQRKGFFGFLCESGVHDLEKKEAEDYWEVYVEHEVDKGIKEISGIVASKGESSKVTGKVKIVLDPKEAGHFKSNEILVTTMTTPEFIFIMKNALAIVTDTGGLTSHAAIVSRELGKPCIIGTKITTKVLKDGDEVEVDANEGIVRIIKRANGK